MEIESLLPEAGRLTVERLRIEPTGILLELRCTDVSAQCPDCKCSSRRVHSRYPRSIDDLPWRGQGNRIFPTEYLILTRRGGAPALLI